MGVEWSSERMIRRPFGSVNVWYCSFGGRTAALSGETAAVTSAASRSVPIRTSDTRGRDAG